MKAVHNADPVEHDNRMELIFLDLIVRFDLRQLNRGDWREISQGRDRYLMQRTLLDLAKIAYLTTKTDRLLLLKAAHAVLPLHGSDLQELAYTMIEEHNNIEDIYHQAVPLEWSDVLIEALRDQPHPNTGQAKEILSVLRQCIDSAPDSPPTQLRVNYIGHQILSMGYRPSWLSISVIRNTSSGKVEETSGERGIK